MTNDNWNLYNKICDANECGENGNHRLALMIIAILRQNAWHERHSGDALGTVFRNETFEDYLLSPVRHGCGIESLSALRGRLESVPHDGPKALKMLLQEIPDFLERTDRERQEVTNKVANSDNLEILQAYPSQTAAAQALGITQGRVSQIIRGTPNKDARKARVNLSPGTSPTAAAARIREKLGEDFASALGQALLNT